jgi:hypothetical protein
MVILHLRTKFLEKKKVGIHKLLDILLLQVDF